MLKTGTPTIETIRGIVAEKQARKIRFVSDTKPMLLDLFSASAMMAIYDSVNDDNKNKISEMIKTKTGMLKYINFCFSKI